ncbi:MAG: hypothetical protein VX980_01330 [Actinomycetota bacterium]|nr:hypothetical protein [Actinomycetota bacterium]
MKVVFVRAATVLVGLVLFGTGVASMFLADLGVGPWDVLHDALAGLLGRQPGTVVAGLGVILLGVVALARQPIGLGTAANVLVIGSTVNLVLALADPPTALAVRLVLMVAGPLLVAFGSMLYIGAGLGIGPRDGIMTALNDAGLSLRTARTLLEVTVLVLGGVLGGSWGVGTLVFALLVGPALQFFRNHVWSGLPESYGFVYRRR